jgi:hypothetical protein
VGQLFGWLCLDCRVMLGEPLFRRRLAHECCAAPAYAEDRDGKGYSLARRWSRLAVRIVDQLLPGSARHEDFAAAAQAGARL